MPSRSLRRIVEARVPVTEVAFQIEQSGSVSESEIERELLPLIYSLRPERDDTTGRLSRPMSTEDQSKKSVEFFLTQPDAAGLCHIGGLRVPIHLEGNFLRMIQAIGWTIDE